MQFYLGTNKSHWLRITDVPLFVSHRTLRVKKNTHPATTSWCLDSGGFTELSKYGKWTIPPRDYVQAIKRYRDEIGKLVWAAPQDWMCEPQIISNTGLSVAIHQELTISNYLHLLELDASLPIIPVLQGWALDDYKRHIEMYDAAGIDLARQQVVGLGSVCRRQNTQEIATIVRYIKSCGIKMHGFGVKVSGLKLYGDLLQSADSMAWSFQARQRKFRFGKCTHAAKTCSTCLTWALEWRRDMLLKSGLGFVNV